MQVHIPTMFMMIIFACLSLALSVAWVTWRDNRDGLRTWAFALLMHAFGYVLLELRGHVVDFISIVVAGTMISLSYSMFLLSVHDFFGEKKDKLKIVIPPIIIAVSFFLLMGDVLSRVILGSAIYIVQMVFLFKPLLKRHYDFPVRGRNLIVFGMVLVAMVAVLRMVILLINHGDHLAVIYHSAMQIATFGSAFTSLILVSNGFVMMSKERSDERLRTLAMKDKLTGCWNRIRIEEVAAQEMARLKRYGYQVALIMIDLDHFKKVNDQHGHLVGDTILRGFADIALHSLRSTDMLGRWGGEEFLVILPSSGAAEAYAVAERIRVATENFVFPGGHRITISLGVAACRASDSWNEWLGRADKALYQAKTSGRNQVQIEESCIESDPIALGGGGSELVWNQSYECGGEEIDAQHRMLFDMANGVFRQGVECASRQDIATSVAALLDAVRQHFVVEERILAENGYGHFEQHQDAHRRLMERAEQCLQGFVQGRHGASDLFDLIMYELISHHMLMEDAMFRAMFNDTRRHYTPLAS